MFSSIIDLSKLIDSDHIKFQWILQFRYRQP